MWLANVTALWAHGSASASAECMHEECTAVKHRTLSRASRLFLGYSYSFHRLVLWSRFLDSIPARYRH